MKDNRFHVGWLLTGEMYIYQHISGLRWCVSKLNNNMIAADKYETSLWLLDKSTSLVFKICQNIDFII